MCSEIGECMQECTASLESVQRGSRVCSNVGKCAARFGACVARAKKNNKSALPPHNRLRFMLHKTALHLMSMMV